MLLTEMLNVELVENTEGRYVCRTKVVDEMLQPHGVLHGGISAFLAEHAASRAVNTHLDGDRQFAVGLEVSSTHLEPVMKGDTIETVATPVRNRGRIRVWRVEQFRMSDGVQFNVSQVTICIRDFSRR